MASNAVIEEKEKKVDSLAEEIKAANVVLLVDYRGITVDDVTKLRSDLRDANAKYRVIKNNIIKRALDKNGDNSLDELLEGPTALIMGEEDYLAPAKIIYNFTKDHDFYKIKGGIVEGKVMTAEEIITLAKLPSRETLLSMLAGALLGNVSKFAVALEQVRLQKEAGVEPEAKTEEPKAEEKAAEEVKTEEAKSEEPVKAEVAENKEKSAADDKAE